MTKGKKNNDLINLSSLKPWFKNIPNPKLNGGAKRKKPTKEGYF